jgi:uncharacterized protein
MPHLIAHVEIPSTDLDRSKNFYNKLFGWEFKPFGNDYYLFNNRKGITAGLRKADSIAAGDKTIFHVWVDSIEEVFEKVKNNGGKVEREKTTIPVMGFYALLNDPDGNTIGLFQGPK